MNFLKKIAMLSLLVAFAIIINACSADPSKDIDALKAKFSAINAEEAQGYLPDLFGTVQQGIVAIDQEMAAQQTKGGMFKDYANIKQLIAKANTDLAGLEAELPNAKVKAKDEVAGLITNLDSMVVEADSFIATASKSKALKAQVPTLTTELQTLKTSIEQVKSDAAAEKYYSARATALMVAQKFTELKNSLPAATK